MFPRHGGTPSPLDVYAMLFPLGQDEIPNGDEVAVDPFDCDPGALPNPECRTRPTRRRARYEVQAAAES